MMTIMNTYGHVKRKRVDLQSAKQLLINIIKHEETNTPTPFHRENKFRKLLVNCWKNQNKL